ncbi:MAG: cupin domain-containing protein [Candidatus Accumulibacter sp.]|jgi:mannose-6-phosphate isomerase-like protein (cupin superfamily)|uniref:cupin domain-containing protein n=1 Tax=Accumulibacter sp. TaxID=2053492 RepID=UPI001AC9322E|nr:cupin domain-containing protein [Accumulibacter sp.]MBK8117237.1 cupin domain-containing protein [Accumulibacter sp.]MBK8386642.1 cupin domain-containing protein [Accumulibacter sp.]MBK8579645.1 cupin domain-containing protein [Candidatus Accumulibacter propinquus]MBN8437779.1 cupin domain-containing protein [Accumulibacter sp.]
MKTSYRDIVVYTTRDGSAIRELMHPARHGNERQSLAEAVIRPGEQTRLHRHQCSEELYHVTRGTGIMTLAGETLCIGVGDTILIPPQTPHCVAATGNEPLHILCCCSPPYRHEDTELL